MDKVNVSIDAKFQSTLPRWGATRRRRLAMRRLWHFNPRSPDGERLGNPFDTARISVLFQSTLPGWGATCRSRWPSPYPT